MTINVQVSCIKHSGGRDRYGHILGIGGVYNGTRFYYPEAAAIIEMRSGRIRFYTSVNGSSAWLKIESRNNHEYLKTEADGTTADNLLKLQNCP